MEKNSLVKAIRCLILIVVKGKQQGECSHMFPFNTNEEKLLKKRSEIFHFNNSEKKKA